MQKKINNYFQKLDLKVYKKIPHQNHQLGSAGKLEITLKGKKRYLFSQRKKKAYSIEDTYRRQLVQVKKS